MGILCNLDVVIKPLLSLICELSHISTHLKMNVESLWFELLNWTQSAFLHN